MVEGRSVANPWILLQEGQHDLFVTEQQKADVGMTDKRDFRPGNDDVSPMIATHGIQRNRNSFRHLEGLLTFRYQEQHRVVLPDKVLQVRQGPRTGANITVLARLTTVFLFAKSSDVENLHEDPVHIVRATVNTMDISYPSDP